MMSMSLSAGGKREGEWEGCDEYCLLFVTLTVLLMHRINLLLVLAY